MMYRDIQLRCATENRTGRLRCRQGAGAVR